MKNVPENELFSAYLDGELSADEQTQVERLLAASPAARQLVDDLRALSASLQALPTYRIGEDISAQVLRRAERRMLSEPAPAGPGAKDTTQAEGPPWLALLRRVARPRNLVWPSVAVAVALFLMVLGPDVSQEPSDGTIAMRTPDELAESLPAPEMAPSMGAAADEESEMFVDIPTVEPTGGAEERFAVGKRAATELRLEAPRGVPSSVTVPAPVAPKSAPAMKTAPRPSALGEAGGMGGGQFGGYGVAAGREVAGERNKRDALPTAKPPAPEGEPPETTLVVWCDVTARAVRERLFQGILEKRQITWDELAEAGRARKAGVSATTNAAPSESGAYGVAAKPSETIQLAVEATPGQLQALLTDLDRRPDEFSLLSYTSSPSVTSFANEAPQGPGPLAAQESAGTQMHRAIPLYVPDGGRKRGRFTDLNVYFETVRPGKAADHLRLLMEAEPPEAATVGQLADSDELGQTAKQEKPRAAASRAAARQSDRPAPAEEPAPARRSMQAFQGPQPMSPAATPAPADDKALEEGASKAKVPEKKLERDQRARKELESEESLREDQVEQRVAVQVEQDMPKLQTEREGGEKLGRPALGERLDRYEPKYRVRFVLRVLATDQPDVAASMAKEPAPADAAAEAAPPAKAAEAAEVDP